MMNRLLIQVVLLFLPLCSCQNYAWTDIVYGCIRNNNDWSGIVADVEACQKRCEDETSFACLSIDYNNGNCHLSRFNRDSIIPADHYTQPCYVSGWQYVERRSSSCFSGSFDAITRTSDGNTYAFKGTLVIKFNDIGTELAPGFPKPISDVFPGIPSNLDAAVYWSNGKTYFFKGEQYWRTTGTSLDSGYPLQISENWQGLPNNIDAGVLKGDDIGYFFKGTEYWRYNSHSGRADQRNLDISTYLRGYSNGTVDAALRWSNGVMYIFNGEHYWRYNDDLNRVDSGYPLMTTNEWMGCPANEPTIPLACVPESCTGCFSGSFDAITRTSDGNTYAFKGTLVIKFNDVGTELAPGFPKPISDVFPWIPSNLDAAVYWSNGKTYFFKGEQYWRTTGTSLDSGYPLQISENWQGLPNNIDAGVLKEYDIGYFFKGTEYWRYNSHSGRADQRNLDISTYLRGYSHGTVDAAFRWSNGVMYIFNGEHYWRYNDDLNRVDSGYPLMTTNEWMGCPINEPTIPLECVPESCTGSSDDEKWTEKAEACIRNHNDWFGDVSSYVECQISCEEQSSFTCLSIDYEDGRCHHSRFNRQSIRPISDFTQPCYNGETCYYAERLDIEYAWTDIVYGCIRNNNDWVGSVMDVEACQKRCEDESSFICLSIDYKDGSCKLSRFNRDSIRPTDYYTQPCYGSGWQYAERRDIKYFWTETVEGCIRDNNGWTGRVSSLADCQKKCLDEGDFTCLSIDYNNGDCNLSRFHRNTVRPTGDYTQPCFVSGWSYAERAHMGQWTPVVGACIRGHNIRTITVPDIDSCILICSQEDRCCSIDYKDENCNLSPNNRANVIPPDDYIEPCVLSGWQYSERVDKLCSSH